MQLSRALVIDEHTEEYQGKKGTVRQVVLSVVDLSPDKIRLTQPVNYAMNDEEQKLHAGKLRDKMISLGIRELSVFNGQVRSRGAILEVLKS